MNAKGYYKWLLDEINVDYDSTEYDLLFSHLYNRIFTWSVKNDDNRSGDGVALRRKYLNDGGAMLEKDFIAPCNVLEMMIALSVRCDCEILGDPDIDKRDKLFWIMIDNLGLDVYTDDYYEEDAVDEILDIWLLRRFDSHGNGSPFPVNKSGRNQKKMEIWFQMNEFLNENFDQNW